jgi:hypothetical protein
MVMGWLDESTKRGKELGDQQRTESLRQQREYEAQRRAGIRLAEPLVREFADAVFGRGILGFRLYEMRFYDSSDCFHLEYTRGDLSFQISIEVVTGKVEAIYRCSPGGDWDRDFFKRFSVRLQEDALKRDLRDLATKIVATLRQ